MLKYISISILAVLSITGIFLTINNQAEYEIQSQQLKFLFEFIFLYYIFTLFPFTILGIILGLYQLCRYKIYNFRISILWFVIMVIIIGIARIFKTVYFPNFGCDECIDNTTGIEVILGMAYGLFGSILIYALPFYRLISSLKKIISKIIKSKKK